MVINKYVLIAIITTVALATNVFAGQTIYKWKDSKGMIKYTQSKPPAGTPFETINHQFSNNQPKESNNAQDSDASSDSADEILTKQAAEKQRVSAANEEIAKKNCEIAKNNLQVLESRTMVQVEEKGQRRLLTDTERSEKLAAAKENIAKYCN